MRSLIPLFLLLVPVIALSQTTVFQNVTLVDVERGRLLPGRTVVVAGERIHYVGRRAKSPSGARVIDGRGRYLMPGLTDFNTYVLQYETEGSPAFALMVAHGVTSARDLLSPVDLNEAAAIRQSILKGERIGPRLFLSGKTLLDRAPLQPERQPRSAVVHTAEEATLVVDSMIRAGADVIETRTILDASILQAITREARRQNVRVLARHSGNWATASSLGVDAFTHLSDLWRVTSTGRERLFDFSAKDSMRLISGAEFYNRVLPSLGGVDTVYLDSLAGVLRRNNTWLVPGFASYFQSKRRFEHADTARLRFKTARQLRQMEEDRKAGADITAARSQGIFIDLSPLRRVALSGVRLVGGTQMETFVTPGLAVHDVMSYLAEAQFSPAEILRSFTLHPAQFLGREKELGTIRKGRYADLVLLDQNPLADIRNCRRIEAVVINGRVLLRPELDRLLRNAEAQAGATHERH